MTQLTLNIEDHKILPHLKKILNAIEGVSIAPTIRKRKSGIEEALEDVAAGRITRYDSLDQLFKDLDI